MIGFYCVAVEQLLVIDLHCMAVEQVLVIDYKYQKFKRSNWALIVLFQAVEQLLVMSSQNLVLVEHHSMMVKYRIPITDISAMSVSPHPDKIIVFHVQKVMNKLIQL